jgi:thioesterase domain-containing protein
MAQQLKRIGDDVAFLAMMETYNWSELPHRSIYDKARFLGEKWLFHWRNLGLLSDGGRASFLANKSSELKNRTRIWAGRALSVVSKNGHVKSNSVVRQSEIWKLNDKACFRYKANFYDGRLTVFLTKKRYSVHSVPEATWNQNHAREIDAVILPFYPAGMLIEPFVTELAKHIDAKIARALPYQ